MTPTPPQSGAGAASVSLPATCAECDRPFENGDLVQFGNRFLHVGCFRCASCREHIYMDDPNASGIVVNKDGAPLCTNCGYRCALCQGAIADEAITSDDGDMYHPECFSCGACGVPLEDLTFVRKGDKVLCKDCHTAASTTAAAVPAQTPKQTPPVSPGHSNRQATIPPPRAAPSARPAATEAQSPLSNTIPVFPTAAAVAASPATNASNSLLRSARLGGGSGSGSSLNLAHLASLQRNSPMQPKQPPLGVLAGPIVSGTAPAAGSSLAASAHHDAQSVESTRAALQTAERTIASLKLKLESEMKSRQQAECILEELQKERESAQSAADQVASELRARVDALRLETSTLSAQRGALQQEIVQLRAQRDFVSQEATPRLSALPAAPLPPSPAPLSPTTTAQLETGCSKLKEQVAEYQKELVELERSRRELEATLNERASYLEELFNEIDSLQESKTLLNEQLGDMRSDALVMAVYRALGAEQADPQSPRVQRPDHAVFASVKEYCQSLPGWEAAARAALDAFAQRRKGSVQSTSASFVAPQREPSLTPLPAADVSDVPPVPPPKSPSTTMAARRLSPVSTVVADAASADSARKQKGTKVGSFQMFTVKPGSGNGPAVAEPATRVVSREKTTTGTSASQPDLRAPARRERRPHAFELHSYKRPRECDYCGEKMWGKELKCADCMFHAHVKCAVNVLPTCAGPGAAPALGASTSNMAGSSAILTGKQPLQILGAELSQLVAVESQRSPAAAMAALVPSTEIPRLVQLCVAAAEERGMEFEGLYRKSGSISLVNRIVALFSDGALPDLVRDVDTYPDISAVTSTLKKFFMDLCDPLLTYQLYPWWMASAAHPPDAPEKLEAVRETLNALPAANRATLAFLMRHLARVTAHSAVNKMSATNLGVVWGPSLLKSPDADISMALTDSGAKIGLVEYFILHAAELFP